MSIGKKLTASALAVVLAALVGPAFAIADEPEVQYLTAAPLTAQADSVTLADGTYSMTVASKLSADSNAFASDSYAVVKGDEAWLVLNGTSNKYAQFSWGDTPSVNEDGDAVVGAPVFKSGKSISNGLSPETVDHYQFTVPVSKSELAKAVDGTAKLGFFKLRFAPKYINRMEGDWYSALPELSVSALKRTGASTVLPTDSKYLLVDHDIKTKFGMLEMQVPAYILVDGSKSYVLVTSHVYDGKGHPKYDALYLGKYSDLKGKTPSQVKLLMGIPLHLETGDDAADFAAGGKQLDGNVYAIQFVIPLSTSELQRKLEDGKPEDVYYVSRYAEGYVNNSGETELAGQWSGTMNYYFALEGDSESQTYFPLENGRIDQIAEQVYTGLPIQPEPKVYAYGKYLVKNNDYTVEFSNNTKPGTAQVKVKGIGKYTGELTATFEIVEESRDLAKAKVEAIPDQNYTNKNITPTVVVTYNGEKLTQGVNFTASYANNVNPGTATVTLTGKGFYTGSLKTTFKIVKSKNTSLVRRAGEEALDTMAEIVNTGWQGETGGTVVLATDGGYWDALTAAGIAGMAKAPVLMTNSTSLSPQTKKLLQTMKPKKIIVCGGQYVVSDDVVKAAEAASGGKATRAFGETMTDTADDVYNKAPSVTGGTWSTTAFVATSNGYWDALAAAPISYSQSMPIFLTESKTALSEKTIQAMKAGGIQKVIIVGGEAVVASRVELQLRNANIEVLPRLAGETAIDTSVLVAKYGVETCGMSANNFGIATQNGYWDALAGAALCGKLNSVLVLVDKEDSASINDFAKKYKASIARGFIFGGKFAISTETEAAIAAATKL